MDLPKDSMSVRDLLAKALLLVGLPAAARLNDASSANLWSPTALTQKSASRANKKRKQATSPAHPLL